MFGKLVKNWANKYGYPEKGCGCREPRSHRDCAYCGCTAHQPDHVCGVCKEAGIDGKVIRGTERRTCSLHLTKEPEPTNKTNRFMHIYWCDHPGGSFSEDQCSDLGKQVLDLIRTTTGGIGNHRRANKASIVFTFYQGMGSFMPYSREVVLVLGDRLKELLGDEKVKVKVVKHKTHVGDGNFSLFRRRRRESVTITLT